MARYIFTILFAVLVPLLLLSAAEQKPGVVSLEKMTNFSLQQTIQLKGGGQLVAGHFSGKLFFADTSIVARGRQDFIVIKLTDEHQLQWLIQGGGREPVVIKEIAAAGKQGFYISGSFAQTIEVGEWVIKSHGRQDVFLARINTSGKVDWLRTAGGLVDDRPEQLQLTDNGAEITATFYNQVYCWDSVLSTGPGGQRIRLVFDESGHLRRSKIVNDNTAAAGH